jgi:hypothetical protein
MPFRPTTPRPSARRSNARPVRPRAGTDDRGPAHASRPIERHDRQRLAPEHPADVLRRISARDARFTTNPSRPSIPSGRSASSAREAERNDRTSTRAPRRCGRRSHNPRERRRRSHAGDGGRPRPSTSRRRRPRRKDASIEGARSRRREQYPERLRMGPERLVQMGGVSSAPSGTRSASVCTSSSGAPPPRPLRRRPDPHRSTRSTHLAQGPRDMRGDERRPRSSA